MFHLQLLQEGCMGPLRFERKSPPPQGGRIAKLPHGPILFASDISRVLKYLCVHGERFNIIYWMKLIYDRWFCHHTWFLCRYHYLIWVHPSVDQRISNEKTWWCLLFYALYFNHGDEFMAHLRSFCQSAPDYSRKCIWSRLQLFTYILKKVVF